ncbi:NADH-quinone oxidoreductase, L subunit domain protein [Mycobacterium xenopi 4042]|uniref:NADH-quinone oxidoreductase, L subunit domain protein n=1 Tax=Mycobacterium xenopi 4042 TaxID=1299334 RepID=X7ZWQ3_MYCXE|nr:NADH-quinone oxidoreductase, L subunit domain protein [Mycobacterium xenopi 4042]EUA51995.1 NADH-quinone oxidoreductase, L subunit domain protein [Mycobacterium xenopi 3993]
MFMRPGAHLTRALVKIDEGGVDGAVEGIAALLAGTSTDLRRVQSGFVRSYALSMFAATALVLVAILAVRLW